ncbi:DUF3034 family protein [Actimicrobium sp. CCC2.4]|uniref:DUF3034 family protein n=1 Tax=Actimicrobium sp. CCC2.4 TaxID=3048606 RepID=UPI002AC9419A|nr:DUF3034 family protein [Actimicrobium sp. CCC2.4]MEB0135373.1 DUF3034 family protein [Actimicrobium sp. CCC2.4]WPX32452.1 DUF3034 family protein [Actimicrobium sp. CCC2.4]
MKTMKIQAISTRSRWRHLLAASVLTGCSGMAAAQWPLPDQGKLLALGGASQIEGAGGGGLTPWALITGYGTRDSYGGNVHYTGVRTQDYAIDSAGVAFGFADRFEISLASQKLQGSLAPLAQLAITQDIVGLKLKLAGDALADQDRLLPQIALGVQYKRNRGIRGLDALGVTSVTQLGARNDHGIDVTLSATKILLDQSLLLNATLRATKANQFGLLGFGGDLHDRYQPMLESSVVYLINRQLVAGIEYRMKPRNLSVDKEKDAADVFVGYFLNRNVSVMLGWVTLGDVTIFNPRRQSGAYLSLQGGF